MAPKEYKKLHAEWYELRSGSADEHTEELEHWVRLIKEAGEPVLELGSGTGRILVPLLERGLDVVGIDTSTEMTARCLAACEARGLTPEVHAQSMLDFDLSREFGLIFLDSGGLGLFTSDGDIAAMFDRVRAHLKPGGMFVYEFQPVRDQQSDEGEWKRDQVEGPDGVVMKLRVKARHDASTNTWQQTYIVEKHIDGKLVEEETNHRVGRLFTTSEAVGYAEAAGFVDIRATDWLTRDPPDDESVVVTIQCKKPHDGPDTT